MKLFVQNKGGEWVWLIFLVVFNMSCHPDPLTRGKADIIFHNAFVYPVSSNPLEDGAIAVSNGEIIDIGSSAEIVSKWRGDDTELHDCNDMFLMPGFIEGHGHFSSLGLNLIHLDLLATTSWSDIIDSVSIRTSSSPPGSWIVGRGWHQEKWRDAVNPSVNGYPYHDSLSLISPEHPVMLTHASGHSLFANKAAMDAAGISRETPDPAGGRIVRDQRGTAIGIFEENAMAIIEKAHKDYEASLTQEEITTEWFKAIEKVQEHCLAFGITSFQDAGSTLEEISRYHLLAEKDSLEIRLWAMLRQPLQELEGKLDGFPIIRAGQNTFTSMTIKAYIDGALGSYGAWLNEPYLERPGYIGQNTTPVAEIEAIAELCIRTGMQMAVHAIGDKANGTVLDIYEEKFKANPEKNDLRWRIEHAQHIAPRDIPRFKDLNVIASMQAIHCTSDAPFVEKRIGTKRAQEGAYVWRSLIDHGVVLANGTDAPVERIDPIANFYASVTRRRPDTGESFFPEQSMTREEALKSYTWNNAYAAFEEDIKGSLEKGKLADLVLLDQNILTCSEDSILLTKVMMTIVGGEVKYRRTN